MPTDSSYPKLDIPDVDIWTLLFERPDSQRQFPEDKCEGFLSPYPLYGNMNANCLPFAVIYNDPEANRTYTYAQVRSTAIEFGKGLRSNWDWKKGDVLALFTPNCVDTPAITWGTLWAGGILSPANPGYTADELAFQLTDSGAKGLVTQKPFLSTAREACKKAGIDEDRIILMGEEKDETFRIKHFSAIKNLAGTSRYRKVKINPKKDLAFLVYSSGTTGHPKGVMLSHSNIVSNVMMGNVSEGSNLKWNGGRDDKGDQILAFLPFFHIYVCESRFPHYAKTN